MMEIKEIESLLNKLVKQIKDNSDKLNKLQKPYYLLKKDEVIWEPCINGTYIVYIRGELTDDPSRPGKRSKAVHIIFSDEYFLFLKQDEDKVISEIMSRILKEFETLDLSNQNDKDTPPPAIEIKFFS